MTGLCEGGNEPPGSLKASKYFPYTTELAAEGKERRRGATTTTTDDRRRFWPLRSDVLSQQCVLEPSFKERFKISTREWAVPNIIERLGVHGSCHNLQFSKVRRFKLYVANGTVVWIRIFPMVKYPRSKSSVYKYKDRQTAYQLPQVPLAEDLSPVLVFLRVSLLASKLGAVVGTMLAPVLATVMVVVFTSSLFPEFKLENHLLFLLLPTLIVKKKLNSRKITRNLPSKSSKPAIKAATGAHYFQQVSTQVSHQRSHLGIHHGNKHRLNRALDP
ncbi:hypothetical protein ANN_24564 [Periplaneta americana]|uniref:Uncharacterized protein n=1 Tax=Periplaneta americana TaxID=6978 RepID=A0ABQ8S3Q2_PERAM|nr:hypothetical protein ANN_24564 [Periplaneta americana]